MKNPHGLVFTSVRGHGLNHRHINDEILGPALEKANVKRIGFHGLRHSYATAMICAGENIKFIQKQLGHSIITETLDTYGHLLPDLEEDAPERIGKVFGTTVEPRSKTGAKK